MEIWTDISLQLPTWPRMGRDWGRQSSQHGSRSTGAHPEKPAFPRALGGKGSQVSGVWKECDPLSLLKAGLESVRVPEAGLRERTGQSFPEGPQVTLAALLSRGEAEPL